MKSFLESLVLFSGLLAIPLGSINIIFGVAWLCLWVIALLVGISNEGIDNLKRTTLNTRKVTE